ERANVQLVDLFLRKGLAKYCSEWIALGIGGKAESRDFTFGCLMNAFVREILNPCLALASRSAGNPINDRLCRCLEAAVVEDSLFGEFLPINGRGSFNHHEQHCAISPDEEALHIVFCM